MTVIDMGQTPAQTELSRASHAQAAIENPLIGEALAAWESEITEQWKTSPLRDVEGREKLRLMLAASKAFQSYLQTTMETGQVAREQIQREQTLAQRVRGAMPW